MKISSNFLIIILFIIVLQITNIQCVTYTQQITTKFENNEHFKRSDSKMLFAVTCVSNDTVYCGKIIKSFNSIGRLLTSVILFKETLLVNVTIDRNCYLGEVRCTEDETNFVGQAKPGSISLLQDEHGVERYYHQPLAKQFYSDLPEYDSVDIHVRFAIRPDYWFQGDPLPTTVNSTRHVDFTYLALREMIHALGFYSSWRMWFSDETIIVPRPHCYDGIGPCSLYHRRKTHRVWADFKEFIFDKYLMILSNGEMLTNKTNYLNKLFDSKNQIHGRIRKLERALAASPQYNIAKEVYELATTNGTIGFLSWNDTKPTDCLVLETSITPFSDIINLNYVDNVLYNNTSDFLMRYPWPYDKILQNEIFIGGNYGDHENGTLIGAIGPKLLRVLETLGYSTAENPVPSYVPKIPPPRPPIVQDSLGNSLSSISLYQTLYQPFLLLIIVLAYEIYF